MIPCHAVKFEPLAFQADLPLEPYDSRDDAGAMLCPMCLAVLRPVNLPGVGVVCAACERWAISSPLLKALRSPGQIVYSGWADATPPPPPAPPTR